MYWDLNPGPSNLKSAMLTLRPLRLKFWCKKNSVCNSTGWETGWPPPRGNKLEINLGGIGLTSTAVALNVKDSYLDILKFLDKCCFLRRWCLNIIFQLFYRRLNIKEPFKKSVNTVCKARERILHGLYFISSLGKIGGQRLVPFLHFLLVIGNVRSVIAPIDMAHSLTYLTKQPTTQYEIFFNNCYILSPLKLKWSIVMVVC